MFRILKKLYKDYWEDFHVIRKIEWGILKKWLNPKKGEVICDLACGRGFYSYKIASKNKCIVHGIDIDDKAIEYAKKNYSHQNVKYYLGSADHLPFEDSYFDKLYSVCSLEHFENVEVALQEINRVLKPGSSFVFSVDSFNFKGIPEEIINKHKKEHYVVQYLNLEVLSRLLKENGFKILRSKYIFNSKLSAKVFNFGIKIRFSKYFLLFFPVFYPLVRLSDYIFGRKDQGYILVLESQKE